MRRASIRRPIGLSVRFMLRDMVQSVSVDVDVLQNHCLVYDPNVHYALHALMRERGGDVSWDRTHRFLCEVPLPRSFEYGGGIRGIRSFLRRFLVDLRRVLRRENLHEGRIKRNGEDVQFYTRYTAGSRYYATYQLK